MAALVFNCPRCVYRISIDGSTSGQSVQCPCCRQFVSPPGHATADARGPRAPIQQTTELASDDFDVDERTLSAIRQRKSGESQGATLVFGLFFGGVLVVVVAMISVFNWWKSTPKKPTIAAKVLAELEQGKLEFDQRNVELRERHAELEQRNTQPAQSKSDASTPKAQLRRQSVESVADVALELNDDGVAVIKDVASSDIYSVLQNEGFKLEKDVENGMLVCKRDLYEVEIYGLDGKVWQVRVLVMGKWNGKDFIFGKDDHLFFGKIASLAYDGTDNQEHRSWAESHFTKDGRFNNGKSIEQTLMTPYIRMLFIRPIGLVAPLTGEIIK